MFTLVGDKVEFVPMGQTITSLREGVKLEGIDGPSIPRLTPAENLIIYFSVPNNILTASSQPSMIADTACKHLNFSFDGIDFSEIIHLTLQRFINLLNENPNYDGHMVGSFRDEFGKAWEFIAQNICTKLVTKFILMSTDRETIDGFNAFDNIPDDDDSLYD